MAEAPPGAQGRSSQPGGWVAGPRACQCEPGGSSQLRALLHVPGRGTGVGERTGRAGLTLPPRPGRTPPTPPSEPLVTWPPQDSSTLQGVRVAEGWHSAARAACREDRPGRARAGGTVPSVCLVPVPDERGSPSTRGDQPRRGQPSPGPRGHRGFPQKAPSGLERLERPHLLEDGVPAGAGRHGPPQRRGAVRPAYPRALLWSRGGRRFPCRPRGQQQLRARADAWAQPPPGPRAQQAQRAVPVLPQPSQLHRCPARSPWLVPESPLAAPG